MRCLFVALLYIHSGVVKKNRSIKPGVFRGSKRISKECKFIKILFLVEKKKISIK